MLSRARFNVIYNEQSSAAQKVYDAVPIAEHWPTNKIIGEMARLGTSSNYRVVAGCLNTLLLAGLLREPRRGEFVRAQIKEPETHKPAPQIEEVMTKTVVAIKPEKSVVQSPIDKINALAMRTQDIISELQQLASDLTDAAVDIQADVERNTADALKLKQLHALLASVG